MAHLKKRVASQKILQFLQNNKVIFFFQKKSVESDHWRLLKKKIAKIEGVASLNIKNKRDKREIEPLILSHLASQESVVTLSNSSYPKTLSISRSVNGVFYSVKNKVSCKSEICEKDLQEGREKICIEFPSTDQTAYSRPSGYLPQEKDKINGPQHLESENRLEMVERICGLLYAPNLILGSDSLKKLASLSFQLKEDSNLIFIGGVGWKWSS